MTPVFDKEISEAIYEVMYLQLKDNTQARELKSDGTYIKITNNLPPVDSQFLMEQFITNASKEIVRSQKVEDKIQTKVLSSNKKNKDLQ